MSTEALRHREAVVGMNPLTLNPPMHAIATAIRQAVALGGDLLVLAGVLICIPFVILAIGAPVALFVQLLLWIGRLL